jgi:3,4-dihydroxy 2-butanone 4-phosphate synthase/GTP cyclohydrolase II
MTNNPEKSESLQDFGIHVVEQVPLTPRPNKHNLAYLRTKRDRMGHSLPGLPSQRPADA